MCFEELYRKIQYVKIKTKKLYVRYLKNNCHVCNFVTAFQKRDRIIY